MVAAACMSSRAGATWLGVDRLSWIALIVFTGRCLAVAWFGPFPNAYDERAHFSFALHVLQTGDILPSLDALQHLSAHAEDLLRDDAVEAAQLLLAHKQARLVRAIPRACGRLRAYPRRRQCRCG